MSEVLKDDKKLVFKCSHCENDDMRHFVFYSLEYQSEQFMNSPYKQNWNRETTPKIPVGVHIRCAKCNKDTFIIPDSYQPTMWGNDIPQQCIVNVKYEKPAFSAVQYILTEDGYLDQVVVTANNEMLSLVTKTNIEEKTKFSVIGKSQYELLLSRGLKEVGFVETVAEPEKKPVENQVKINNNDNKNKK